MTDPSGALSVEDRLTAETLIIDVDGFEGPLDVLLTLGRSQKVDLRRISILHLARQYLAFVDKAQELRLELAADYLVMAAWLAFLKSRLLLPPDPEDEAPTGEELAGHLAFQLQRLQAMRDAAARIMARDQLGRDFFARGVTLEVRHQKKLDYRANLLDLMKAYARIKTKDDFRPFVMDREATLTMEQALDRLRSTIGFPGEWRDLTSYLPPGWQNDPIKRRSAMAATFAASLELVKEGLVELRQSGVFEPIEMKKRNDNRDE